MFLERKRVSMYSIIGLEASMYLLISFCTEQSAGKQRIFCYRSNNILTSEEGIQ
jgi:hypothetical protein